MLIEAKVRDSCGKSRQRETPQEQSDEEAPGPPAESECLKRKSTSRKTNALPMSMLKPNVDLNSMLIEAKVRDSCGKSRQRETPQEQSDEEAPGPPAESECLKRKSTSRKTSALPMSMLKPNVDLNSVLIEADTRNSSEIKDAKLECENKNLINHSINLA